MSGSIWQCSAFSFILALLFAVLLSSSATVLVIYIIVPQIKALSRKPNQVGERHTYI
uniref:Putative membrane protein n=1 Tax=Little cherry virus 2 TaxID=154339 RepID=A0A7D0JI06_9CLOS|nr:putative membrane protein [Little cherry virus 2]